MRNLRFNHTCEHRFVFAEGEEPQVVNGDAFPVTQPADVPDTDFKAQVWRLQRGAEVSLSDRDADKLSSLKDADGIAFATEGGDLAELPVVAAPDPTDPMDRTPREEAEAAARDAGHTLEGVIEDHDRHRDFARRIGIEPGGPVAAAPAAPAPPPPPRPATAPAAPGAGRSAAPPPQPGGSTGTSTAPAPGPAPQPAPATQQAGAPAPQPPPAPGSQGAARAAPAPTGGQQMRAATGTAPGPNAPAPAMQRANVDLHGTLSPAPQGEQPQGQQNPGVPNQSQR